MNHCELQTSLAQSIDPLMFKVMIERGYGTGEGRVDVVAIAKSYCREIRFYEVKASKSDFDNDVKTEKYHKYLPHCDKFYFAIGPDLDVQYCLDSLKYSPVGLVYYKDGAWKRKRGAPSSIDPKKIPERTWISFLIGESQDRESLRRQRMSAELERLQSANLKVLHKSVSKRIRAEISELETLKTRLACTERDLERDIQQKIARELGMHWFNGDVESLVEGLLIGQLQEELRCHIRQHLERSVAKIKEATKGAA